jgi:hypothetical protein
VQLPATLGHVATWLALSLASALLVAAIPRLRTPPVLLAIGLVSTAALYREAFPAYLALCAAVFLAATRFIAPRERPPASRWKLSLRAIVVLLLTFIAARGWMVDRYRGDVLGVRLAMYYLDMSMLLRLVNFLWETGAGRVRDPSLRTYALWSALPFTAFGPLLRFSDFDAQLARVSSPESTAGLGDANWWRRLALASAQLAGAVVVAAALGSSGARSTGRILVDIFVLVPWSFYLLSAGSMTFMECLARSWGFTLPRSYDRPFVRPNISEFWAHWNMSATSLFRDYLFYNRWGRRTVNVYVNVIVLFFLVGVWHDGNPYWMPWGLLHGLGFAAFLLYKKWRATPAGQRAMELPRPLAIATTYVFVCGCWAAPPQILKLIGRFT